MRFHRDKKILITCLAATVIGLSISVPLVMHPAFHPAQAEGQEAPSRVPPASGASAKKNPDVFQKSAASGTVHVKVETDGRTHALQPKTAPTPAVLPLVLVPDFFDGLPAISSDNWRLILVSPSHKLPEGYEPVTRELAGGIYETAVYNHYQYFCDVRIFDDLTCMLTDCTDAGFQPLVASGYREHQTQIMLFEENIASLEMQGMSREEAENETKKVVAVPGTSEHELGLAVDIACEENTELDASQLDTPTQKWLMENSWKYGFIVRYPTDKTEETGIIFEPWHYRYVGKESAAYMHERGLCLEEYVERLHLREEAEAAEATLSNETITPQSSGTSTSNSPLPEETNPKKEYRSASDNRNPATTKSKKSASSSATTTDNKKQTKIRPTDPATKKEKS
uniref:M15 family metallopeptidase n=1 Tax=Eubacterium cellulosolvens TaxID=29322 RepID=UPI000685C3D5|nr:M15 family metallopeptidase [[Eubacterium] cellulosolvens]